MPRNEKGESEQVEPLPICDGKPLREKHKPLIKMENKHKDMKLMKVWVTSAEKLSILESLIEPEKYSENIIEIIENADKRGDIIW